MFIKLINAASPFQGKTIVIKKDIIISVFESEIEHPELSIVDDEDSVVTKSYKEKVTTVFCGAIGTWQVKETVDQIYKLLKI
jgi:hypothetical protein